MRHSSKRAKTRNKRGNGAARSQVFDSNGPDVRIRGTAHQVYEKYTALAKDAMGSGDMIMAENYNQHAEHYRRIINSFTESVDQKEIKKDASNNTDDNVGNKKAEKKEDEICLELPSSILTPVDEDELEDA